MTVLLEFLARGPWGPTPYLEILLWPLVQLVTGDFFCALSQALILTFSGSPDAQTRT